MADLVGTGSWTDFATRLEAASANPERLAVAGHHLDAHEQIVRFHLPSNPFAVVDAVDHWTASVHEALAGVFGAASDAAGARALLRCATLLDRRLARQSDAAWERAGAHPQAFWGPFTWEDADPLVLMRWPRGLSLPIDRQSLVARAMKHHRILGRGPGGMSWDLAALGQQLSRARRQIVHALLGRGNWPLRIVLWPASALASSDIPPRQDGCVEIDPTNDAEIVDEVREAIAFCVDQSAHILVLPELYLPEPALPAVSAQLHEVERAPRPVLTALGLTHRRHGDGWANEAVVLDHRGSVLWRHAKTAPFVGRDGIGECLRVGKTVALRYGPAGWFAVMLCLDLFAPKSRDAVLQAAPSLVLAPSLSRSTSAHLTVANQARAEGIATAVANRPLDATHREAESLFVGPATRATFVATGHVDWHPEGG